MSVGLQRGVDQLAADRAGLGGGDDAGGLGIGERGGEAVADVLEVGLDGRALGSAGAEQGLLAGDLEGEDIELDGGRAAHGALAEDQLREHAEGGRAV